LKQLRDAQELLPHPADRVGGVVRHEGRVGAGAGAGELVARDHLLNHAEATDHALQALLHHAAGVHVGRRVGVQRLGAVLGAQQGLRQRLALELHEAQVVNGVLLDPRGRVRT